MRNRIIEALNLGDWGFLIPNYSFLLALALLLGAWITLRQCRRQGIAQEHSLQAVFYALLLVLPSAHLVYVLQFPGHYANFWQMIDLSRGGIALYGGLLGVVVIPSIYLTSKRIQPALYLDALTPSLALGLCLGRLGCFLAGCNWGIRTDLPWGVSFPGPKHAYAQQLGAGLIEKGASLSLPVHPTQLYEASFGLLMLPLIFRWLKQTHRPGEIFVKSISCYALFRFLTEFLRADAQGVGFGFFSFAQALSVLVFVLCLVAFRWPLLGFFAGRAEAR